MFTKLPVPMVTWEEKKGPDALCFLPIVGFFSGLFVFGMYYLCYFLQLSADITAFIILISMFAISGFVHLDGFMDVSDAFLSSRDREGKIEILKDSRVGAFSVIAVVLLILMGFVSIKTLLYQSIFPVLFLLVPMVSRNLAALIIFLFHPLQNKGLMFYFKDGEKKYHLYLMIASIVVLTVAIGWISLSYLLGMVLSLLIVLMMDLWIDHSIGGINGDVAGATIVMSEFISYFVIVIIGSLF